MFSSIPATGSPNQLDALFDYATIGIVVTNHIGEILNFNAFAQSQFGYTKEEVLGQSVEMLIPASVHERHRQYRKGFYQEPHPRSMGEGRDLFAQRKDGSVFPVEVSLSHYEVDGSICVFAFVIDITVRKRSEVQLVNQKAELEKLTTDLKQLNLELEKKVEDRTHLLQETMQALEHSKEELSLALQDEKDLGELKSRFVTMASHEFRTPLTTILSSAYLTEQHIEQGNYENAARHLARIKDSVGNMKNMLEEFLSLGKLEEGFVSAAMERLTTNELFTEIENTLQQLEQMKKPGQKIDFIYDEISNQSVLIDRQFLKNILINLLTNAIKFSPENSVIIVECKLNNELLKIRICDQGMGILEEERQYLFRRFFRAKNTANIPGTGLGLHIVAKYLELMNGKISCMPAATKGTIFMVSIPQKIS